VVILIFVVAFLVSVGATILFKKILDKFDR
jgi:hypothetical protein